MWFSKCLPRLKVVKVTDQVPFSSSVVDANTTFLQVHIISHTVSSAVLYTGILVLLSSPQEPSSVSVLMRATRVCLSVWKSVCTISNWLALSLSPSAQSKISTPSAHSLHSFLRTRKTITVSCHPVYRWGTNSDYTITIMYKWFGLFVQTCVPQWFLVTTANNDEWELEWVGELIFECSRTSLLSCSFCACVCVCRMRRLECSHSKLYVTIAWTSAVELKRTLILCSRSKTSVLLLK